jgi:hypothetical protein
VIQASKLRRHSFQLVAVRLFVAVCVFGLGGRVAARAAEDVPWSLPTLFKKVPPLKHDATGRLPLICIEPFKLSPDDKSFAEAKPFPAATIRELVKRGLTQFIPPNEKYIPFALALRRAGARVIMVEGNAFNGPAGEVPDGPHQLPADFKRDPDQPAQQPRFPCPRLLEGWRKKADELRATFRKFKAAGVNVDAVWLDWEIEPLPGKAQWREAKACARCRKMFPPEILDDFDRYKGFIWRLRVELLSAYAVAPILEIYPTCSVTNWEEVISTAQRPTAYWSDSAVKPPVGIGMFTAANPVAYGNTAWYGLHWKAERKWPLDTAHMDRIYTQVMLAQISDQAANAGLAAPEKQCIPWVDRFCADDRDEKIPILTRSRYREILRHCWLRGADGMQIFNPNWFPNRPERVAVVTEEIEDAVAVYDEMLAFRPILDRGRVMNTAKPKAEDDGPIWSGRQLGDTAIVRAFTQGKVAVKAQVEVANAHGKPVAVELDCPPRGQTYRITVASGKPQVEPVPEP